MKYYNDLENKEAYEIVKRIKKKNNFSHAYIVQSNNKEELNMFSKFLVKNIICDNFNQVDHDEKSCPTCYKINGETYLEVEYVEPDGLTVKIDQIRSMQQKLSKKAFSGSKKVYVVKTAERLGEKSSNAMLKLIEEPEANIFCLLLTDNIYSIIPTIRSRCQKITLSKSVNALTTTINSELAEEIICNLEKRNLYAIQDIHKQFEKKEKEEVLEIFDEMIFIYKKRLEETQNKESIFKIKKILKYKRQIYNNINLALLLDKVVIELGGNKND
jgi:DNA polymerase III delta prime subunit